MGDFTKEVKLLAQKASQEKNSVDALRFSQAALNLSHTSTVMYAENEASTVFNPR